MCKLLEAIKNRQDAKDFAIEWQNWQSTQALSYGDLFYWQSILTNIGKKFGLISEFKENGII